MDTIIFGWTALVLLGYMLYGYVLALLKHDFSVVDVVYGLGFVVAAWTAFLFTQTYLVTQIIALILVSIWGIRLSSHIYVRNKKKGVEDFRYTDMRNNWGKSANIQALFKIYIFSGIQKSFQAEEKDDSSEQCNRIRYDDPCYHFLVFPWHFR